MLFNLITALQLFGIGFSFGIIGPCSLSCNPILITYIAATKRKWIDSLGDILYFLSGRLLAYIILGYLAGLSAVVLRKFISSDFILFLKPVGGIIVVLLGIFILAGKDNSYFLCKFTHNRVLTYSNIFVLGFIVGIMPCVPLLALLFEIALISKTAFAGMAYALFFGLGTFFSGLIIAASLAGIFTWLPEKILKSKKGIIVFKVICALLLVMLGLSVIFSRHFGGNKQII